MLLSKITINNFRLIVNAELDVHRNITLIVGRNNTAKTSCMSILEKVVKNKVLSYNDYPLQFFSAAYSEMVFFAFSPNVRYFHAIPRIFLYWSREFTDQLSSSM